jgi:hypothetical protein
MYVLDISVMVTQSLKKKTQPLSTDVAPFIQFLKAIPDGTIVLMGTYDDGATKYVNVKPSMTFSGYNL